MAKPHASVKDHLEEAMATFWKDATRGRVLFATSECAVELGPLMSVPLGRVPKMNPDRTDSGKGRMIHDERAFNAGCPKEDHPPALQPRHQDLIRLLVWWSLRYPGITVLLYKKDVSDAFKWLWNLSLIHI